MSQKLTCTTATTSRSLITANSASLTRSGSNAESRAVVNKPAETNERVAGSESDEVPFALTGTLFCIIKYGQFSTSIQNFYTYYKLKLEGQESRLRECNHGTGGGVARRTVDRVDPV